MRIYKNNKLITPYCNNTKISFMTSISNSTVPVENIILSDTAINLKVGETHQLTATILPSNATNKDVIWESYNEGFATVSQTGLITAVHEGSLSIRCISKDNPNINKQCDLIIKNDDIEPPVDLSTINKVPFISTYHIEHKVDINDEVIIKYYVTDYEQKEYRIEDNSETFIINYWINGNKFAINNVKAGDNSINLGKLPAGEVFFDIQATDTLNRKSHKLFYQFMVLDKVADEADILAKTYNVTDEDLTSFGISKDGTNPIETTDGLNELIVWASEQGHRKIVLPNGTYMTSKDSCVAIQVDNIILDLNGSLFKLEANNYDHGMQIKIIKCRDSHVINGIIEGDLDEHDFDTAPNSSEWVHGIEIGSSEYCSFKDIILRKITGYGTTTIHNETLYTDNVGEWVSGDLINGVLTENQYRISSNKRAVLKKYRTDLNPPRLLYDLTRETGLGWIQFGVPLGYQGNITDNWMFKMCFYDENDEFIEDVVCYSYRRVRVPLRAMYIRLTLFTTTVPSNSSAGPGYVRFPLNGAFINITHEDVRCCGTALCATSNFLMDGCTYSHCGWALARCAFNTEDGWDHTQDLTFRNGRFIRGTSNGNTFLLCSGHNIIGEDNDEFGCYVYERVRSLVFRNNIVSANTIEFRHDDIRRSGYSRIYNNDCYTTSNLKSNSDTGHIIVKDMRYHDGNFIAGRTGGTDRLVKAIRCSFENAIENAGVTVGTISATTYEDCDIKNLTWYVGGNNIFNNSRFDNVALRPNSATLPGVYNNCTFTKAHGIYSAGSCYALYNDCTIEDLRFSCSGGNTPETTLVFTNCEISYNALNTIGLFKSTATSFYVKFVNCTINDTSSKAIIDHSKAGIIKGKITFDNCIINKTQGVLVHDNYNSSYHGEGTDLNIHLINTPISIPVGTANVINNPAIWKIVIE